MRRRNKLIVLSLSAVWRHVMDETTYTAILTPQGTPNRRSRSCNNI